MITNCRCSRRRVSVYIASSPTVGNEPLLLAVAAHQFLSARGGLVDYSQMVPHVEEDR